MRWRTCFAAPATATCSSGRQRSERSLHSHHEILAMVQAGDDAGARRAMDHHLTTVEPANISDDGKEE